MLASGELVKATYDNEYKDLLWALMGYGGGKLGIVVEFTYHIFNDGGNNYNYCQGIFNF